ncbi:MAG: hypothetical protein KJ971_02510 [Firmicutes bacterium]|nr:hypothetical protein [Bacillota bacterium]
MRKTAIKAILLGVFLELILGVFMVIAIFLFYNYFGLNFELFQTLKVVSSGVGIEKLWLFLYLGSAVGFYILFCLIFFELVLFLLRTMIKVSLKAIEKIKNNSLEKYYTIQKRISLFTLFRVIKINTPKRGLIAYFVIIALVWGSGLLGKAILSQTQSYVFRSYEQLNLYSDETLVDFTSEIALEEPYQIQVTTGVGSVHLYQLTSETDLKIYYLYDTLLQKDSYSLEIDETLNLISISFNESITSYELYQDDVMPSVEIYLPATLLLDEIDVQILNVGNCTMEYVDANKLSLKINNGTATLTESENRINEFEIEAISSTLKMTIDEATNLVLTLDDTLTNLRLYQVDETVLIDSSNGTDIFFYTSNMNSLQISAINSRIEMREVYTENIMVSIEDTTYIHINSNDSASMTVLSYIHINCQVTLKGVKYDQDSLS